MNSGNLKVEAGNVGEGISPAKPKKLQKKQAEPSKKQRKLAESLLATARDFTTHDSLLTQMPGRQFAEDVNFRYGIFSKTNLEHLNVVQLEAVVDAWKNGNPVSAAEAGRTISELELQRSNILDNPLACQH